MTHVVVIHGLRTISRQTNVDNVLSLSRNLRCQKITNVNVFGRIPRNISSDVVILTYDALALRTWPIWNQIVNRITPLIESTPVRIAFPQDDYTSCQILDEFFSSAKVKHVYSPIKSDLEVLYPKSTSGSIRFAEALTGYVDNNFTKRAAKFSRPFASRELDLGQRVRLLDPHLGSRAAHKAEVAVQFAVAAENMGFSCDVSTRPGDVLLGENWYRFLGNSRFTVGAKGGASIADPRGKLADKVRRMKVRHPHLSHRELGDRLDLSDVMRGDFSAISPRLFEAAAMGTCQILLRDHYFEGFEPWKHYVPLDSGDAIDSRLWEVMRDFDLALEIVQASQEFLIETERFTYASFLARVALETGIQQSDEGTVINDSSADLDVAVGNSNQVLPWLQSYLSRAISRGILKRVERELKAGRFLQLTDSDSDYSDHVDANREKILSWIDAFRGGDLMIESLVVPWRTASSFMSFPTDH